MVFKKIFKFILLSILVLGLSIGSGALILWIKYHDPKDKLGISDYFKGRLVSYINVEGKNYGYKLSNLTDKVDEQIDSFLLPFIRGEIGKKYLIEDFFQKIYEKNEDAENHFYNDFFYPLLAEEFYQTWAKKLSNGFLTDSFYEDTFPERGEVRSVYQLSGLRKESYGCEISFGNEIKIDALIESWGLNSDFKTVFNKLKIDGETDESNFIKKIATYKQKDEEKYNLTLASYLLGRHDGGDCSGGKKVSNSSRNFISKVTKVDGTIDDKKTFKRLQNLKYLLLIYYRDYVWSELYLKVWERLFYIAYFLTQKFFDGSVTGKKLKFRKDALLDFHSISSSYDEPWNSNYVLLWKYKSKTGHLDKLTTIGVGDKGNSFLLKEDDREEEANKHINYPLLKPDNNWRGDLDLKRLRQKFGYDSYKHSNNDDEEVNNNKYSNFYFDPFLHLNNFVGIINNDSEITNNFKDSDDIKNLADVSKKDFFLSLSGKKSFHYPEGDGGNALGYVLFAAPLYMYDVIDGLKINDIGITFGEDDDERLAANRNSQKNLKVWGDDGLSFQKGIKRGFFGDDYEEIRNQNKEAWFYLLLNEKAKKDENDDSFKTAANHHFLPRELKKNEIKNKLLWDKISSYYDDADKKWWQFWKWW